MTTAQDDYDWARLEAERDEAARLLTEWAAFAGFDDAGLPESITKYSRECRISNWLKARLPLPPTPATGGEGEPKQQWRVVSRDRDGDDEWEVDDHGPYTEEAALKRAETWNIGSNSRRFKAQRIPATSPAVPDSWTEGEP